MYTEELKDLLFVPVLLIFVVGSLMAVLLFGGAFEPRPVKPPVPVSATLPDGRTVQCLQASSGSLQCDFPAS